MKRGRSFYQAFAFPKRGSAQFPQLSMFLIRAMLTGCGCKVLNSCLHVQTVPSCGASCALFARVCWFLKREIVQNSAEVQNRIVQSSAE
jgi:hypothetical protein